MTHRAMLDGIFLVRYWADSRAAYFAVCANSWRRGRQV